MSGASTPSRRLSRTTTRVAPTNRRNALSCSSAQIRTLERNTSRRTHFRLYPSVNTNSGSAVLARLRVAHHGAGAIIDLSFLTGGRLNHCTSFRRDRYLKLAHEALHALIARAEAMTIDQVLPDRHRVAAMREAQLDCFLECGGEASRRLNDRRRFRNLYQLR